MKKPITATAAGLAAALTFAYAYDTGNLDGPDSDATPTPSATSPYPPAPEVPPKEEPSILVPANPPGAVEKVLVVVEENRSFTQMWNGMPYLRQLSKDYAYAKNSHGSWHPSQPNYVIMAAGTKRGITNNNLTFVT